MPDENRGLVCDFIHVFFCRVYDLLLLKREWLGCSGDCERDELRCNSTLLTFNYHQLLLYYNNQDFLPCFALCFFPRSSRKARDNGINRRRQKDGIHMCAGNGGDLHFLRGRSIRMDARESKEGHEAAGLLSPWWS